ncbi:MAG TPA: DUF1365 domain-containing protein [Jatrophihabitans sp.]|nr:DUF1365 domain-containing protein [Jatrophihabitans sp.]
MVGPATPARYDVEIGHRRRDPIEYGFQQRSSTWLVDLDAVPRLPRGLGWLVRFASRDHLGDPRLSLRDNLNRFVVDSGRQRPERILMLANPRVLGYVFNPLSVFYCYGADGRLAYTVAEVRNTYGGRHTYLLETDGSDRARTDKRFYVSPFYPVDGYYTMSLPEPDQQLTVTVTLHRPGDRPFAAVMQGRRVAAVASLWTALRSPLATRAVMFGIKRHGITLYLKGLRPYPRGGRNTRDDPARPAQQAPSSPGGSQPEPAHTKSVEVSEAR